MRWPVVIMSPKGQFVKCVLCVLLYLIVCLVLIKLKNDFYTSQYTEEKISDSLKNNIQTRKLYGPTALKKRTKQSVDSQIKILQHDERNGKSLNLKENVAILQKISDMCLKKNLQTPVILRHFLYSQRHKSLYCWIRKVGSTSFTKLFSEMNNRSVARDYYREVDFLALKHFDEFQRIKNDKSIFKFMAVRHPFERLVSSYRDRIEDNTKYTAQAWVYAKKIFYVTRPELFRFNGTTGNFFKRTFTADKRLKEVPTFREFIQWLLQSTSVDDVHWNQYYTHCGVCNINYNYVLKLDSYTFGEINYILSKFGLDDSNVGFPNLERTRGGITDYETTCKYFRLLTKNMVLKLYEKYKIDFELYNYSPRKYMFCTNTE